jgi:hypothetical protein
MRASATCGVRQGDAVLSSNNNDYRTQADQLGITKAGAFMKSGTQMCSM